MNSNVRILNSGILAAVVAVAALAVIAVPIEAKDREIAVNVAVSTAGLDLRQVDGARGMYARLSAAASTVCGNRRWVALQREAHFEACYEGALGNAIRSINSTMVTSVYLETHTAEEAGRLGIDTAILRASR